MTKEIINRQWVIDNWYLKAFHFSNEMINWEPLIRYAVTPKWESTKSRLWKLLKKKNKTDEDIAEQNMLYTILFNFSD